MLFGKSVLVLKDNRKVREREKELHQRNIFQKLHLCLVLFVLILEVRMGKEGQGRDQQKDWDSKKGKIGIPKREKQGKIRIPKREDRKR